MNGDGHRDLTAFMSGGNVRVFAGDGSGNWTQLASFQVPEPYYSAMRVGGDADHNGSLLAPGPPETWRRRG